MRREPLRKSGGTEAGAGRKLCVSPLSVSGGASGDGDKYGIIGLHENLLFFYSELPATVEPAPYAGKLATNLRPENWGEVMDPHFRKWSGMQPDQAIWKKLVLVLAIPRPHTGKGE